MLHVHVNVIDKVIVIVMIYYPMHLMKCLDNLTCCYIDLVWLNSYITGYYIIHYLEQFILLHLYNFVYCLLIKSSTRQRQPMANT